MHSNDTKSLAIDLGKSRTHTITHAGRRSTAMGLGEGKVAIVVEFEAQEGKLKELRAALIVHAR